jgi:hypothetical protein
MICVGRSILLFGSPSEIKGRMATLRGDTNDPEETESRDAGSGSSDSSVSFDLNWQDEEDLQATIHIVEPPELPTRLSPAQAAQLSELLEYLHVRIRHLLMSISMDENEAKVTLDIERWQHLLDLQARLAAYLRGIGDPEE